MNPSPLAQADLFDDADEDHGPSLRQAWARQASPRRRRLTRAFDPEGAAQNCGFRIKPDTHSEMKPDGLPI